MYMSDDDADQTAMQEAAKKEIEEEPAVASIPNL
jgi:hypothetical protein